MIIDTNGFEIGDEVWWWEVDWANSDNFICKSGIIYTIEIRHYGIFIEIDDKYGTKVHINRCFHSQQECQQVCDELNGKIKNEN